VPVDRGLRRLVLHDLQSSTVETLHASG
jgi:hypothetical protein